MTGKGDTQRPTDHKKWSANYDNIKWTPEEDEEFDRIQNNPSTRGSVAKPETSEESLDEK